MRSKKNFSAGGFSISELMISMLLLTTVMGGAYKFIISQGRRGIETSRRNDGTLVLQAARRSLTSYFDRAGTDPSYSNGVPPIEIPDISLTSESELAMGTAEAPLAPYPSPTPTAPPKTHLVGSFVDILADINGSATGNLLNSKPCFTDQDEHVQIYIATGNNPYPGRANWLVAVDPNLSKTKEIIPDVVYFGVRPVDEMGKTMEVPWRNDPSGSTPNGGYVDRRGDVRSVEIELWVWIDAPSLPAYEGPLPPTLKFFEPDSGGNWRERFYVSRAPTYPSNRSTMIGEHGYLAKDIFRIPLVNNRYDGTVKRATGQHVCTT